MKHVAVQLLILGAIETCGASPKPPAEPVPCAPHSSVPATAASAKALDAVEAPADDDPPSVSGGTWTACMISRADLEAETKKPATIAPAGGEVLALQYVLVQGGVRNTLDVTVGLPAMLVSRQKVDVRGNVRHRMRELEGGIEAGDTVVGTVTAQSDPSQIDVTLKASDMLKRWFASDASINRFTVKVVAIHHVNECR